MSKTISSLIFDAETKMDMWLDISNDNVALSDRNKTRQEALLLANYFEGKLDAFYETKNLLNKSDK